MAASPRSQPGSSMLSLSTQTFDCLFDQDTGFLRRISVGHTEVIRAIYGAVRDGVWNTIPSPITDVRLTSGDDWFALSFQVECRDSKVHFRWSGQIHGRAGALEFIFEGEALTTFQRNRIGLCVLHPLVGCVGRPCRVLSVDGDWSDAVFPEHIAPHQPFKNVRALAWTPASGVRAEVSFEGEIFETEDQRNWTDASFKTYGTPLEMPMPVTVEVGTRVRQVVRVNIERSVPIERRGTSATSIRLRPEASITKPAIGLCVHPGKAPLSPRKRDLLRNLALSHLRVDLQFAHADWPHVLERAHSQAAAIGASLHCALHFSENASRSLDDFAGMVRARSLPVALVLPFIRGHEVTPADVIGLARERLGDLGVEIAVGTDQYFAELNRNRPEPGSITCFSLNPQVHAFDDLSLIENLEAQAWTIRSALAFGAREIAVSPITLRPRFNQHSPETTAHDSSELPASADLRQRTLFGAVWTLGSLAQFAPSAGVHSLTWYETIGPRGVMEFSSTAGEVFPMYHVFADLAGADRVIPVENEFSDRIAALALQMRGAGVRLILGNLTTTPQTVRVAHSASQAAIRLLDENSVAFATSNPEVFRTGVETLLPDSSGFEISLQPSAIATLDFI